jgi:hypothetical protein
VAVCLLPGTEVAFEQEVKYERFLFPKMKPGKTARFRQINGGKPMVHHDALGVGMPSRDFTNEDLFSSPTMSMHNSTHSSQMNTVGPAMSLRTSCWLLPQNVQWSGVLVSPLLTLLISEPRQDTSHHSRDPAGRTRLTHDREGQLPVGAKGGGGAPDSSIIEETSENP